MLETRWTYHLGMICTSGEHKNSVVKHNVTTERNMKVMDGIDGALNLRWEVQTILFF